MRLALVVCALICVSAFANATVVDAPDYCATAFPTPDGNFAEARFAQVGDHTTYPVGNIAPGRAAARVFEAEHPKLWGFAGADYAETDEPELREAAPRRSMGAAKRITARSPDVTHFQEIRPIFPEGIETRRFRAP